MSRQSPPRSPSRTDGSAAATSPGPSADPGAGPNAGLFATTPDAAFGARLTWALAGVALAARVAVAWRAPIIESDGAYYATLAGRMLAGDPGWLSPAWPPLYPAAIAAVAAPLAAVTGGVTPERLEGAARAVSVAAGVAMLLPFVRLARRLLDARGAAIATALVAAHPRLIAYSGAALTESLYTACLVAAAASAAAAQPLAAGVGVGLASLARAEAIPLAVVVVAAGLVTRRLRLAAVARFVAGLALVAAPYLAMVSIADGRPSLGEKPAYNLWRAYRTEYARHFPAPVALERRVNEPELSAGARPEPVRVVELLVAEPSAVVGGAARRLGRLLASSLPWVVTPPLLALAVAGATRRGWRVPGARAWLALPIVALAVLIAPASDDRRFLVPVVPFALLLAAAGWRRLEGARRPGAPATRPGRLATTLLLAMVAAGLGVAIASRPIDDAPEHRAAGVWLRDHAVAARPVVRARKPWVAFYAGGVIASLPEGGHAALRREVAARGGGVVVWDERWARPHRPELAAWLDSTRSAPPVLHRVSAPLPLVLLDVRGWRDPPVPP